MKSYDLFQDRANIAKNAICSYVIFKSGNNLTNEQFKTILNFISPVTLKYIDDASFINNQRLKEFVDYKRLDRKQVIRLMTKDIHILDYIDVKFFNFSISELEFFIINHPNYIRHFNFDLTNITGKEIIILLKSDLNFIYEVNIKNTKFSRLEFQDLLKHFSHVDFIMDDINFDKFDNFLTRMTILLTNDKYIEKLNLNKLNYLDWLEILKAYPEMLEYCDISLFKSGDYFKLAQLVCVVPELDDLLKEHYDDLSALAWEKLLSHDPYKYGPVCNFKIFKEVNWKNALKKNPGLVKYKKNAYIS